MSELERLMMSVSQYQAKIMLFGFGISCKNMSTNTVDYLERELEKYSELVRLEIIRLTNGY